MLTVLSMLYVVGGDDSEDLPTASIGITTATTAITSSTDNKETLAVVERVENTMAWRLGTAGLRMIVSLFAVVVSGYTL